MKIKIEAGDTEEVKQAKQALIDVYESALETARKEFKLKSDADFDIKSDASKEAIKANAEEAIKGFKVNDGEKDVLITDFLKELDSSLAKLSAKVQSNEVKAQQSETFEQSLSKALEGATDQLEKFNRKETKSFVIELKAVGDMSTGNVTGGSRYGQLMNPNIIQNQPRKVHLMDIIPGGNIGPGNTFTFMRENGAGEGNPAPVAEGASKPQFDFDLVEATVNIETIAGWLRVTRKAMSNIPGFLSFLNSRIPERFKRVLDSQILYGTGTTPELKGILVSGNFVASTTTLNTFLAEKITNDIAILEDTYERTATGILLRPIDLATFYINKSSGSGEYDLPDNVSITNGQIYISGVPVYQTTALTSPDYVVGDFQEGAQFLTQEGMRIEFFEQDADNVTKNKVTIRVEGNYALPVYGSNYFIKGTTARA